MAQRPIDSKAAERCASIVGAKQKGDEAPPSHVSVTDFLSWFRKLRHVGLAPRSSVCGIRPTAKLEPNVRPWRVRAVRSRRGWTTCIWKVTPGPLKPNTCPAIV